jgi:hypothetical protein
MIGILKYNPGSLMVQIYFPNCVMMACSISSIVKVALDKRIRPTKIKMIAMNLFAPPVALYSFLF